MSRLLALEWDDQEARVVVGLARGGALSVEHAFAVPLPPQGDGVVGAELGSAIRDQLQQRRVGRVDCLVGVGRPSIELKHLTLPPSPDEDLPDLVRFQASRDFHSLGEDWPLDFMPLSDDPLQSREVLAVAIAPSLVEQASATCRTAELTPKRLLLRPCSGATLLRRQQPSENRTARLLVDLLNDAVDLTVLDGETVVFLRTVRMATHPDEAEGYRPLLLEIRRTLAAMANRLSGRRIETVYLCGDHAVDRQLAEQLASQLQLPVLPFDPWQGIETTGTFQAPEYTGRYAALLGMLQDEIGGGQHPIDFLNPRRRPVPPSRRRQYVGVGAAVAAVVLLVAGWLWMTIATLDAEIESLQTQIAGMKTTVEKAQEIQRRQDEIDKWAATEVNWLEELRYLSQQLPPAEKVMLSELKMITGGTRSEIDLAGVAASSAVSEIGQGLQDARHSYKSKSDQPHKNDSRYVRSFRSSIAVRPDVPLTLPNKAERASPSSSATSSAAPKAGET